MVCRIRRTAAIAVAVKADDSAKRRMTMTKDTNNTSAANSNARDRRRMRRRQANAEKTCAPCDPSSNGTNEMAIIDQDTRTDATQGSRKGGPSSADAKGRVRNGAQQRQTSSTNKTAKGNQKGRQSRRRREQRNKKNAGHIKKGSHESLNDGKAEHRRKVPNDSPLGDLGVHFPSLGGTVGADVSGKDVAAGTGTSTSACTSNWSQVAAQQEVEKDEDGDDELQSEIKAKDLTRLSSGLSAQSSYQRQKKKTGEYAAWSDAEDNDDTSNAGNVDIVGAVQTDAAEKQDIPSEMDGGKNTSILRSSRGLNISKMRERWWSALREKKEKEIQQRAETSRIESMTKDDDSTDDDSSSSCSSVSSWDSSSSFSDRAGSVASAVGGGHIDKQCVDLPVAQVEVAVDVSQYMTSPYPLHYAIIKDDIQAVTHLLDLSPAETKRDEFIGVDVMTNEYHVRSQADDKPVHLSSFSLVHLSTFLDMPHMLRLLLDRSVASSALAADSKDSSNVTPLMIACQYGLEACVRVLLGYGPRLAIKENLLGDSVLHICCRCDEIQPSMLRLLLSSSGKGSSQQRILCARNKKGQTAIHVACEQGRTSFVETFLEEAPTASTKALKVEDLDGRRPLLAAVASGNTDVVISLLMWRGNNMKLDQGKFSSGRKLSSLRMSYGGKSTTEKAMQSCPLTEAVSTGNCDMVRLLLEFGGPSVSASSITYDVAGALLVALTLTPSGERCDIIDLLISAGADPYSCCDSTSYNTTDSLPLSHLSALSVATHNGDVEALNVMLATSSHFLEAKREGRRNDPLIQKHYKVLESRERGAIDVSMQESLVRALYWGWIGGQKGSDNSDCLRCCLSLYKCGAKLSDSNFFRLQRSLADDRLSAKTGDVVAASEVSNNDVCFEAHYSHPVRVDRVGKIDKSYWCKQLAQLQWFREDATNATSNLYCSWTQEALEIDNANEVDGDDDFPGEMCLLCVGTEKLLVHAKILSRRSLKLDAAIRFAALQDNQSDADGPIELTIDAPLHLIKLFLQHCYIGSIVVGLPPEPHCLVETLLELALLADEYLCPSLLQECELRLLSPNLSRCYCVNCCNTTSPMSDRADISDDREAMINCLCRVRGTGVLIGVESAADIIAVGRDEGIASTGYQVRAFLPTNKHVECLSLQPFAAASFNAARVLLQNFGSPDNDEGLTLVMLETCLDAISTRSAKEVSSLVFTGAAIIDSTKTRASSKGRKMDEK